ncbi:MAG: DUF4384 domain-containing protein [Thermodesulfobacteriota bacterium]|nr:DUF4384 domain-containing protein [Thermodesulfobacteriota bacterium]
MDIGTLVHKKRITYFYIGITLSLSLFLASCAAIDPGQVDVELQQTAVEAKLTTYTDALADLGLMTEIYGTGSLKIQSNPIGDNTGTSQSTGGEIPRDITEMLKSSLNSIGGNVIFIPYDPAFIQNQMVTGYSNFDDKLIPDVVISGGITEFDRGLETHGEGTDVGAEAEFTGMKDWLPSKRVSVDYGSSSKQGLARITLDFNLLNFKTMAGIARMNTVNSIEVHKAMGNKELGITIFGPTFGRKGSVKKVQGRHSAVRLLVELSMIQMVGKHLALPYWVLLGEDNEPDRVVISALQKNYYQMTVSDRTSLVQEWLFLHGHDVSVTGYIDDQTVVAMQSFNPAFNADQSVSVKSFVDIYTSIPISQKTLGRRNLLASMGKQVRVATQPGAVTPLHPVETPAVEHVVQQQAQPAVQQVKQVQQEYAPQPVAPAPVQRRGIGRILDDEEW